MTNNSREDQKLKTQKKLLNAIERLVNGKAKSKKLKTHRLNDSNVVIEAGQANGSLKHYTRVSRFIRIKQSHPTAEWTDEGDFIDSETKMPIQSGVLIDKAESEIKELKTDIKKSEETSVSYRVQHADIQESMENQLALHHSLTVALFEAIPDDVKEAKLKEFESNVTIGNFGDWYNKSV